MRTMPDQSVSTDSPPAEHSPASTYSKAWVAQLLSYPENLESWDNRHCRATIDRREGSDNFTYGLGRSPRAKPVILFADKVQVHSLAGAFVDVLELAQGAPLIAADKMETFAIILIVDDDGSRIVGTFIEVRVLRHQR